MGILHGAASYVCQNKEGQINETESISAGLDYPGVSPIHCFLKDSKRARYTFSTDEDVQSIQDGKKIWKKTKSRTKPAFAEAIRIAPN